jgi:hypothetical protein
MLHFPEPLRIVVLFPSAGITTEPHFIYLAEISAMELFHRQLFSFNLSMFLIGQPMDE